MSRLRNRGAGAVTGFPTPRPGRGRPAAVPPGGARAVAAGALAAALAALASVAPRAAAAQQEEVLSQDEALEMAFGDDAEVERRTAFLEPTEVERAGELAGSGVEVEEPLVTHYVARRDGEPVGVAYFDAHPVRTLTEVLMIVVGPGDRVERIEVLRFDEPREYRPPEGWLEEFDGARLSDRSSRDVPNITGATLTADAVEDAVRRSLALHEVIRPFAADGDGAGSDARGRDPEPPSGGAGGAGAATGGTVP